MLGGPVRLWEALDGVDVRDQCSLLTLRFNFSSVLVAFRVCLFSFWFSEMFSCTFFFIYVKF